MIDDDRQETVSELRDLMAEALYPALREYDIPAEDEVDAASLVLWSMLSLAVDVALVMDVPLERVQEFCGNASSYATHAKPVRDAERLTAHLRRGEA